MGTIEKNVSDALADSDAKAFAAAQLDTIRSSALESETLVLQMARSMLVLAVSFILISLSAITDVTVLGFKFSDISLVLKVLPAVVAVLYYRMVTQVIRTDALVAAYLTIVKTLHPAYYKKDLEALALPPIFAPEYLLAQHAQGAYYKLFRVASAPIGFVFMVVPVVFEVYAYWHCLGRFGLLDIWTLGSAVFTAVVLIQTLAYWIAARGLSDF